MLQNAPRPKVAIDARIFSALWSPALATEQRPFNAAQKAGRSVQSAGSTWRVTMDVESLLLNWGRWCRTAPISGHCASIEHRYRGKVRPDDTPTGWGDWNAAPPLPPLPAVDSHAALRVERLMRHLPDGHRKALRLHYVSRMPIKLACLRLVIRRDMWGRFLGDAQRMVANLLQRHGYYDKVSP